MELDDFKNKKVVAEDQRIINLQQEFGGLMEKIRADFRKQKRTSIYFVSALITMAIIYLAAREQGNATLNLGLTLLAVGMMAGALYIYLKSRLIKDSIYSLPLPEFISEAGKRLQYMKLSDWMIVVPLLTLLGTGGGLVFIVSLSKYTDALNLLIIIWIVFFSCISIFGIWAGKKDWKKEHGLLFDELRKLKEMLPENQDI